MLRILKVSTNIKKLNSMWDRMKDLLVSLGNGHEQEVEEAFFAWMVNSKEFDPISLDQLAFLARRLGVEYRNSLVAGLRGFDVNGKTLVSRRMLKGEEAVDFALDKVRKYLLEELYEKE